MYTRYVMWKDCYITNEMQYSVLYFTEAAETWRWLKVKMGFLSQVFFWLLRVSATFITLVFSDGSVKASQDFPSSATTSDFVSICLTSELKVTGGVLNGAIGLWLLVECSQHRGCQMVSEAALKHLFWGCSCAYGYLWVTVNRQQIYLRDALGPSILARGSERTAEALCWVHSDRQLLFKQDSMSLPTSLQARHLWFDDRPLFY